MSKTVKDLIAELSHYPAHAKVILSGDAEGNDFSSFASASTEYYEEHSPSNGEIIHPEDIEDYEYEHVVVLWPI